MRNGDVDEAVQVHIDSPWFRKFMSDLLDTVSWGFSVFQFYRQGEWISYDLIPRKHIRPGEGMLLKNQYDTTGISYKDEYMNILEAGDKDDLGLLVKAALYVIYKRNGMADFAQYAELFSQPIREGIYDAWDDQARFKLKQDMEQMGSSAIFIHPEGTKINLIESQQKSGSSQLYSTLLSFCNAEISKLYLGNTLTTEQGDKGARSLGEVHLETERDKNRNDMNMVLDILNYDLTEIFTNLGLNIKGGQFVFEQKQDMDLLEKKHKIMLEWSDKIPINDDQVYEEFGIDKPDNYDELKKEMAQKANKADNPPPGGAGIAFGKPLASDGGGKNRYFGFFGEAPR
jgi:phage gp29-like protein